MLKKIEQKQSYSKNDKGKELQKEIVEYERKKEELERALIECGKKAEEKVRSLEGKSKEMEIIRSSQGANQKLKTEVKELYKEIEMAQSKVRKREKGRKEVDIAEPANITEPDRPRF